MQNQKRIDTYTVFQSTRPSQGETHGTRIGAFFLSISIHSPLAGRDGCTEVYRDHRMSISIHSPLAGRDPADAVVAGAGKISIHSPLAGRDGLVVDVDVVRGYFNPLAPRGARQPSAITGMPS